MQGLCMPCITYGKAQSILNRAQKGRAGEPGAQKDEKLHAFNAPCMKYAAMCTLLPCKSKTRRFHPGPHHTDQFQGLVVAYWHTNNAMRSAASTICRTASTPLSTSSPQMPRPFAIWPRFVIANMCLCPGLNRRLNGRPSHTNLICLWVCTSLSKSRCPRRESLRRKPVSQ